MATLKKRAAAAQTAKKKQKLMYVCMYSENRSLFAIHISQYIVAGAEGGRGNKFYKIAATHIYNSHPVYPGGIRSHDQSAPVSSRYGIGDEATRSALVVNFMLGGIYRC
jgi:hypothetical protein